MDGVAVPPSRGPPSAQRLRSYWWIVWVRPAPSPQGRCPQTGALALISGRYSENRSGDGLRVGAIAGHTWELFRPLRFLALWHS